MRPQYIRVAVGVPLPAPEPLAVDLVDDGGAVASFLLKVEARRVVIEEGVRSPFLAAAMSGVTVERYETTSRAAAVACEFQDRILRDAHYFLASFLWTTSVSVGVLIPKQSTCFGRSSLGINNMDLEDAFKGSILSLDEHALWALGSIYVLDARW